MNTEMNHVQWVSGLLHAGKVAVVIQLSTLDNWILVKFGYSICDNVLSNLHKIINVL